MEITFDPAKNLSNLAKHGIELSRAADMAVLWTKPDLRKDYGEERHLAWGTIDGLYYCLAFTKRGQTLRVISLRRAHLKEIKHHVQN